MVVRVVSAATYLSHFPGYGLRSTRLSYLLRDFLSPQILFHVSTILPPHCRPSQLGSIAVTKTRHHQPIEAKLVPI